MKAKIQTPRGWRRLRGNELVKRGDMAFSYISVEWICTSERFYGTPAKGYFAVIRRRVTRKANK